MINRANRKIAVFMQRNAANDFKLTSSSTTIKLALSEQGRSGVL